jgi:hypothetical protein
MYGSGDEAAKISGARLVDLSGLGSKDEMKAVGLFDVY